MAIIRKKKEVTVVYKDNKIVSSIYKGVALIYQAIRSCFGAGFWRGDKPWVGTDAWKNKSN